MSKNVKLLFCNICGSSYNKDIAANIKFNEDNGNVSLLNSLIFKICHCYELKSILFSDIVNPGNTYIQVINKHVE